MAEQDRKGSTTVPSIQCSQDTKDKFKRAAELLNWTTQEVSDLAGDLLMQAIEGEETPEQRKARMLSNLGSTRVRHQSNSTPTRVAS